MDAVRPSPLQNRVTPFGEIIATPERGLFMGNRGGCFHDETKELTRRRWASRQWITCLTSFKGRRRELMAPGRYTELFFLDEAVAFAAGHRPCAECRRPDFKRFLVAWAAGNHPLAGDAPLRAPALDVALHAERLLPGGAKRTFEASIGDLSDGTFVAFDGEAWLLCDGSLHRWTPGGYTEHHPVAGQKPVATVLTPPSIVNAFRNGYRPQVHSTARRSAEWGN